MNALEKILSKLNSLPQTLTQEAGAKTTSEVEKLLTLNRKQMLEGKTNKGQEISPNYLQDDFFKDPQKRVAYVQFKQRITPNPKRNPITPNLFINGKFHSEITARTTGNAIIFEANTELGQKVTSKFKNVLGLNADSKKQFNENILKPFLLSLIKNKLL